MATKQKYKKTVNKWSDEDRQAFADRNILISHKVPNKKRIAGRRACRGKAAVD
jgi:hypothetical protein